MDKLPPFRREDFMVRCPGNCRTRQLTENIVLFLIGMTILHGWFVEGLPASCQVDGGSMAPTLLGRHVDLICPKCGFESSCDAGESHDPHCWSEGETVACPNCAASYKPEPSPLILSGDRVLIDRTAFLFHRPRRWEVVAFARPDEVPGLTVKRVVGLPGEKVQLADGRVFIDGTLLRRNLRQQRAMRILLHDDQFSGPAPRWRPQDYGSNWTRHDGRPVHTESPNDEIGWLVYNHIDAADRRGEKPGFITDYGYYNRGRMQLRNEQVHRTPDVAMSFRLQDVHGRGMIWLQATDGRDEFTVQIDPAEKKFVVRQNRGARPIGDGDLPGPLRGETFEVSLIDRQFLLAAGSKTLFAAVIDAPGEPPLTRQPLAIGVQGLGAAIDHLRVYRAIYYGGPPGADSGLAPSYAVGPDQYFVLGDNNPISEDSRTWGQDGRQDPMVSQKWLAGKPFLVIYPACGLSLAGWHIQVPDLARIRYIR
jgi:signal peptidase I